MATFHLSRSAENDLLAIGSYTLHNWGPSQTMQYLGNLERTCQQLADLPTIGRACDYIRPGLRRMEQGRRVIFYRPYQGGLLVSRILHQRTLPEHHDLDD